MKFLLASVFGLIASATALKCESGSVADTRSICIKPKFIEGCYAYASEQTCAVCNYNYKLDETTGLCSYNSQTVQSCCLQTESDGKCKLCNRGMSLIEGICVQTESLGCLQKTTQGKCSNCASDFVLENGQCQTAVRNCQQYSNNQKTLCARCQPTYSLAANTCLKNKILGCKKQQNNGCLQCFEPFKPADGKCDIKHCKDYNDFGCQSCECGFYITKKMTCDKIEEGCVRYQKGVCTDCYPPFSLQGSNCIIDGCLNIEGIKCIKCKEQYKLENGICSLPNCLKGKNGRCEICKQGFNYNNGECLVSSSRVIFNGN